MPFDIRSFDGLGGGAAAAAVTPSSSTLADVPATIGRYANQLVAAPSASVSEWGKVSALRVLAQQVATQPKSADRTRALREIRFLVSVFRERATAEMKAEDPQNAALADLDAINEEIGYVPELNAVVTRQVTNPQTGLQESRKSVPIPDTASLPVEYDFKSGGQPGTASRWAQEPWDDPFKQMAKKGIRFFKRTQTVAGVKTTSNAVRDGMFARGRAYEGATDDESLDHAGLEFRQRRGLDADHLQPAQDVISRMVELVDAMRRDPILAARVMAQDRADGTGYFVVKFYPAIDPTTGQPFINPATGKPYKIDPKTGFDQTTGKPIQHKLPDGSFCSVVVAKPTGTQKYYMEYYSHMGNVWPMAKEENSRHADGGYEADDDEDDDALDPVRVGGGKGTQNVVEWLLSNPYYGPAFIKSVGGINRRTILYTTNEDPPRTLADAARAYIEKEQDVQLAFNAFIHGHVKKPATQMQQAVHQARAEELRLKGTGTPQESAARKRSNQLGHDGAARGSVAAVALSGDGHNDADTSSEEELTAAGIRETAAMAHREASKIRRSRKKAANVGRRGDKLRMLIRTLRDQGIVRMSDESPSDPRFSGRTPKGQIVLNPTDDVGVQTQQVLGFFDQHPIFQNILNGIKTGTGHEARHRLSGMAAWSERLAKYQAAKRGEDFVPPRHLSAQDRARLSQPFTALEALGADRMMRLMKSHAAFHGGGGAGEYSSIRSVVIGNANIVVCSVHPDGTASFYHYDAGEDRVIKSNAFNAAHHNGRQMIRVCFDGSNFRSYDPSMLASPPADPNALARSGSRSTASRTANPSVTSGATPSTVRGQIASGPTGTTRTNQPARRASTSNTTSRTPSTARSAHVGASNPSKSSVKRQPKAQPPRSVSSGSSTSPKSSKASQQDHKKHKRKVDDGPLRPPYVGSSRTKSPAKDAATSAASAFVGQAQRNNSTGGSPPAVPLKKLKPKTPPSQLASASMTSVNGASATSTSSDRVVPTTSSTVGDPMDGVFRSTSTNNSGHGLSSSTPSHPVSSVSSTTGRQAGGHSHFVSRPASDASSKAKRGQQKGPLPDRVQRAIDFSGPSQAF